MRNADPNRFRSREGRRTLAHDKNRSATGTMRGHHETIQNSQSQDFEVTGPGVALQDGGSFVHCAGSRFETE
jgi:hypothetical protein